MIRPVHADVFPQELHTMLLHNNVAKKRRATSEERAKVTVDRGSMWKLKRAKGTLVIGVCVMAFLVMRHWDASFLKQIGCDDKQQN